ncbi:MAG: redoxin domain-containing protein [Planctomycetota bacterium]|jgi:peroxiredoxin
MRPRPPFTLTLSILVAAIAVGAGAAPPGPAPERAEVGAVVPDFRLRDTTGRVRRLERYRGRLVVLEWTDPRCPIVARHYRTEAMQRAYRQVRRLDRTAVWLAINSGHDATPREHDAWIAQHRIKYPILLDPDGAVGRLFDARRAPHMFVIDRDGILRYHGAIDDNRRGSAPADEVTNHVVDAVSRVLEKKTVPNGYVRPYGCSVKYAPSREPTPD